MQPVEKYNDIVLDGIRKLSTGNGFTLHLLNAALPSEDGFFEIAISKEEAHVLHWNGSIPPWYVPSSVEEAIHTFDALGFAATELMTLDSFKEIVGDARIVRCTEVKAQFMAIAEDRVALFHINYSWDSLEECHGSYLRTTKH